MQENKSEPKINEPSGERSAIKIVELTPNDSEEVNNSINMVMDDEENWYLENAIYDPETQAGAFRISTPTYGSFDKVFYAGSAVRAASGEVIMSNFIEASPNSNMDFQPQLKFYVQVGSYEAGNVMDFTTSSKNAGFCDASKGDYTFNVIYTDKSEWEVTADEKTFELTEGEAGSIKIEKSLTAA